MLWRLKLGMVFFYSNTANLEVKGWKRVGFEANKERAGNCPTVIHAFVTPQNINKLLANKMYKWIRNDLLGDCKNIFKDQGDFIRLYRSF